MEIDPRSAAATRQHMGQGSTFALTPALTNLTQIHMATPQDSLGDHRLGRGLNWTVRTAHPTAGLHRSSGSVLEAAVRAISGVNRASINAKQGRVFVACDGSRATVGDLLETVWGAGYFDGQPRRKARTETGNIALEFRRRTRIIDINTPKGMKRNVGAGT